MVKIRLKRKGRKKKPLYRIVVIEDSNQRDGKTIEDIGTYNPHTEPASVTVKEDRVKYWISFFPLHSTGDPVRHYRTP